MYFVLQIEPKEIDEAVVKKHWSFSMQERLNQFKRNNGWKLVPIDSFVIGTLVDLS